MNKKADGTVVGLYSYTCEAAGNRATENVTTGAAIVTTTYDYDNQNRLLDTTTANADGSSTKKNYNYDNNGNLTYTGTEKTTTDDSSKPVKIGLSKVGVEANTVSDDATFNEYDDFNELIKTTTGAKNATYAYNGDGLRIQKTVDGAITRYLYDGDNIELETDGTGVQTANNIYGVNLISRNVDGQNVYYLYNGHGDVIGLQDGTGSVIGTYYYDAFGNILETTGNVNNEFRYSGYQYDEETGLYYLNSRMYDPETGRFDQEDTYTGDPNDPLSLNLYTYCHNEPIMYDDPTGHVSMSVYLDRLQKISQKASRPVLKSVKAAKKAVGNVVNSAKKKAIGAFNTAKKTASNVIKNAKNMANNVANGVKSGIDYSGKFLYGVSVGAADDDSDRNYQIAAFDTKSKAFQSGVVGGDIVRVVNGGLQTIGGVAGNSIGFAMDDTVVLAPAGVAVHVASTAVAAHGVITAKNAADDIAKDTYNFSSKNGNGSNKTEVVWSSKPHTNGTDGHWKTIVNEVDDMAKSGEYDKIYVNKGLSNEVPGAKPNNRPDIMGVRKDGKIDQIEVPSKTDNPADLVDRMKLNQKTLGNKAGNIKVVPIKR